ncbi:MAG: ABC transporter substrate-binding protein [Clostridia bacterium]|nr:ABC transporter substrate-binding protein [Clostridia bacterium]
MKKTVSVLLTLISVLCLFACGAEEEAENKEGYTFTDDLEREVTVESCERTAALLGSYADIWMLAGGEICASADDAWDEFDLDLAEDTVNLGNTKELNLEALLAAQPDFVLASTNTAQNLEWQETLEKAGITVAYFDVSDLDGYLNMLKICTELTGMPERYKQYGSDIASQIDEIIERNSGKEAQTILLMRASATGIYAKNSKTTVLGNMLSDFGCINIADSDESLLENISVESIVLSDPDKIFFIQTGDNLEGIEKNIENMFNENPLWGELTAVKEKEVYLMEKRLFNLKPNARWAEAYEKLEAILYAE